MHTHLGQQGLILTGFTSYMYRGSIMNMRDMSTLDKRILKRSRTALWRLIHATAKSSSSLNTYPIPDFFGPAAMQLQTFSRARKILGIRILPRAPTLQTYLFWPIGFNQPRELAQYSSDSSFFGAAAMQRHTFSRARKKNWKLDPIWLPEIRLLDPPRNFLVVREKMLAC